VVIFEILIVANMTAKYVIEGLLWMTPVKVAHTFETKYWHLLLKRMIL